MVGKLARWLRLLGYDARYERDMPDGRLVEAARREERVLLTRDRRLVRRRACRDFLLVESDDPVEQLRQVVDQMDLEVDDSRWFERCMDCNRRLVRVARQQVRVEVPEHVYRQHRRFARCPACRRVYWRGTHVSGMRRRLRTALAGVATAVALVALVLTSIVPTAACAALSDEPGDGSPATGNGTAGAEIPDRFATGGSETQTAFARERDELLEQLRREGIEDEAVLEALDSVPRHEFVPEEYRGHAYQNRPLPIGHDQTISQPYVVALMTELLDLSGDERVLEIGTGSGYQAAILAEMGCEVWTIEIVDELAETARERLQRLGYEGVRVRAGDGYAGWPEEAPFDRIIVTAAPEEIPEALVEQLRVGGQMVVPVGPRFGVQHLTLLEKEEDGDVHERRVIPVRFVPMIHDPGSVEDGGHETVH